MMVNSMTNVLNQTWKLDKPNLCASRKGRGYTRT